MHDTFDLRRFGLALRNDLRLQLRPFLLAVGAAGAIVLIVNVASLSSSGLWNLHSVFYPLMLFVGGFMFTSVVFIDAHQRERAHAYLTLPVSTFERILGRLLLTSLGYIVVSLIAYFAVSALASGLSLLLWRQAHPLFVPEPWLWRMLLIYAVTQSVFFFGAVYFRRYNALKVLVSLGTLAIVLAIVWGGLLSLLFTGAWSSGSFEFPAGSIELLPFGNVVEAVAKVLFWAVMAPLFWVLAFLRLREQEV